MSGDKFKEFIRANRELIENKLAEHLPVSSASASERLNQAITYAVFSGGKRLRAYLTLIASRLAGASERQGLALACAMEFIHTSSLILDDLPAMDDAYLRRNRPALHIAFDQGVAILAALALLNEAYALIGSCADGPRGVKNLPKLLRETTQCIGNSGMVGGQAAELFLSGSPADETSLTSRELKTTGLMQLMMTGGAIVAGSPEKERVALARFGECLGKAYQIFDDFNDHKATGKCVGQDVRHRRPSALAVFDQEESFALAQGLITSGRQALEVFGNVAEAELMRSACDYIVAYFEVPTRVARSHTL